MAVEVVVVEVDMAEAMAVVAAGTVVEGASGSNCFGFPVQQVGCFPPSYSCEGIIVSISRLVE